MKWFKRHYILLLVLLFLVAINTLFYFIGPKEIVEHIGVKNSYAITFVIATIGGLSTLSGTILFTTIATFAAGGSNLLLLGMLGGIGIFISDSIFFYLAQLGRQFVPSNWEKLLGRIEHLVQRYPRWLVLIFVFFYLGLTPLPNDILMLALVLGGYSYRLLWPVLLAGSLSIALITAFIGVLWL